MARYGYVVCGAISVVCLCAGIVAIVCSVLFIYLVEVRHSHAATCLVSNCTVTEQTCYRKECNACSLESYGCYVLSALLELEIPENGSGSLGAPGTYDAAFNHTYGARPSFCDSPTVDCYYDDRDVAGTLTPDSGVMSNDFVAGGIVAISVFSAFTAVAIFWALLYFCCCRPRDLRMVPYGSDRTGPWELDSDETGGKVSPA